MKNIWVIPTNKPSRLIIQNGNKLILGNEEYSIIENRQHIYITSDEEIKEGDWCLLDHNVGISTGYSILKCLESDVKNGEYLFQDKDGCKFTTGRCEKIILTTDQDLIKDGVQAIDDEFLEWFVKNSSCEFVEVKKEYNCPVMNKTYDEPYISYKIIIPKEEPKLAWEQIIETCGGKEQFMKSAGLLPKQETLEEVAERLYPTTINSFTDNGLDLSERERLIFVDGAKWKQERSYSEEEVLEQLNLLHSMKNSMVDTFTDKNDYITMKWFEQFKKK